jgi:hypothetical protein
MNAGGTVWVVITRDSDRRITDLEILDHPPVWFLGPLGQVCYMGNVNGGDSVEYDNRDALIAAADSAGVRFEDWTDPHGHKHDTPGRPG